MSVALIRLDELFRKKLSYKMSYNGKNTGKYQIVSKNQLNLILRCRMQGNMFKESPKNRLGMI